MSNPFSPSRPPRLHVEPLPHGALAAAARKLTSDRGKPVLEISTWLPDRWAINNANNSSNSNDAEEHFIEEHCQDCRYYCDERVLDDCDLNGQSYCDEDGLDWPLFYARANSPCPCSSHGFHHVQWPCCAGHDDPRDDDTGPIELALGPTRLSVRRLLDPQRTFSFLTTEPRYEFTAVLQRLATSSDGQCFAVSNTRRLANTYDPSNAICWGTDNDLPDSLAEAAEAYAEAESNDDLLDVRTCAHNCYQARSDNAERPLDALAVAVPEHTWSDRLALLVADTTSMPDAFLLLTATGAASKDGLAILLAQWTDALTLPDGQQFTGWLSQPVAGNQSWLIGQTLTDHDQPSAFVLLGQLNPNTCPSPQTTPCDSPAPLSSAVAELADTLSQLSPVC